MGYVWIVLFISTVLSYLAIPYCRKLAIKTGYLDKPNNRKTQKEPLPMLGGLGMILVFVIVTLGIYYNSLAHKTQILGIYGGVAILLVVGLIDDYAKTRGKDFPALPKFFGQILACYTLILSGVSIHGINLPIGAVQHIQFQPWLEHLVTILWVLGVINAFNFLDGIDGLAGGIASISGMTLMFVALIMEQYSAALLAATLVGVSLGYLRHNFFPAKIIMGDTGSMFLGYILGAISVMGAFKSVTLFSILVPVLALGLPIFDAILVVIRRILKGKAPHKPDRTHAHHRLMSVGLTQKQTVVVLYLIGTCFGTISIIVTLLAKNY